MTTLEMEYKLSICFGNRQNIIIPNVHWGFNIHECDLLIMSKSGYLTEVEIKISKSDLKRDMKKEHGHLSNRIKYFYFALPEGLETLTEYIPERAGIIKVFEEDNYTQTIRPPQRNKEARSLNINEKFELARLGSLRIWDLKGSIIRLIDEKKGEKCINGNG